MRVHEAWPADARARSPAGHAPSRCLLAALIVVVAGALGGCSPPQEASGSGGGSAVTDVMAQTADEAFERAAGPRPFRFPADHGPHRGFRHEWWYFTGHVDAPGSTDGDDAAIGGFHLTLFRTELEPWPAFAARWSAPGPDVGVPGEPQPSDRAAETPANPWATPEVWMGHAAWIDFATGEHRADERYARGAAGLAGAEPGGRRIWIEDWVIGALDAPPVTLRFSVPGTRAEEPPVALSLALTPLRAPVLQGEAGYSRKGADPGNASLYYSVSRFAIDGTLDRGRGPEPVTGSAWLDREWSTSALDPGQVGWDWFALQFDSGDDLMLYQMRRADGQPDPRSKGRWIPAGEGALRGDGPWVASSDGTVGWETPDGEAHPSLGRLLTVEDFALTPLRVARMRSGRVYPVAWQIDLAPATVERLARTTPLPGPLPWRVVARLDDQEMTTSIPYYEGAVIVFDAEGARIGRGFLEMTGYDAVAPARR